MRWTKITASLSSWILQILFWPCSCWVIMTSIWHCLYINSKVSTESAGYSIGASSVLKVKRNSPVSNLKKSWPPWCFDIYGCWCYCVVCNRLWLKLKQIQLKPRAQKKKALCFGLSIAQRVQWQEPGGFFWADRIRTSHHCYAQLSPCLFYMLIRFAAKTLVVSHRTQTF